MVLFWSINGVKPGKIGEVHVPASRYIPFTALIRASRSTGDLALRGGGYRRQKREKQMRKTDDQIRPTRKGSPHLTVYCLPEEKEQIGRNAKNVGLSASAYLLNVGMGYEIKSTLDSQLVGDLVKVNADLGRLGGLLKLWLTDDKKLAAAGSTFTEGTVRALLKRIEDTQAVMFESVKKL